MHCSACRARGGPEGMLIRKIVKLHMLWDCSKLIFGPKQPLNAAGQPQKLDQTNKALTFTENSKTNIKVGISEQAECWAYTVVLSLPMLLLTILTCMGATLLPCLILTTSINCTWSKTEQLKLSNCMHSNSYAHIEKIFDQNGNPLAIQT